MEKTTEITAQMTDDGYNMYLKNKAGDNTEILSNAVSDDDTVEDFDAENAPAGRRHRAGRGDRVRSVERHHGQLPKGACADGVHRAEPPRHDH